MKQFILLTVVMAAALLTGSCNNKSPKEEAPAAISTAGVNVYYFHFTRRCATRLAVEENARKAIEALYPDQLKTGDYSFTSLNLDEAPAKNIADKLGIGGQSLVVVCGDKKTDITGAAWMAAHDPEKMKAEIRSGIDKVLF